MKNMKGVPFSNKWYTEGVPFLKKMVYKIKGLFAGDDYFA